MDATEARKLSNVSLSGIIIQPFLKEIHDRIQTAAKNGKFEIMDPFSSITGKYPTIEEQGAIMVELIKLGYKVVEHPNPDPGHPCSRSYTTISW